MKKLSALLLAVMMVLSTVSFAAPTMVSTNINAAELFEEVPSTVPATEETAELEADSDLGVLIAKVDFENAEIGKTIVDQQSTPADTVGTVNMPQGFPKLYFGTTQKTITVAEDANGNKYGDWSIGAAGYAKIGFWTVKPNMMPAGTYVMKARIKWVESTNADGSAGAKPGFSAVFTPNQPNGVYENGENNLVTSCTTTVDSQGFTVYQTLPYTLYDGQLITTNKYTNYPFVGYGKIALYHGGASFVSAKLEIDDIELYYKAPDCVITIDDGNPATENTVINGVSGNTVIDLTKYTPANDNKKRVTGFKVTETGERFTTTFTPATAGTYTLVPVYNYYALGLGFEGDEFANGTEFQNKITTDNDYNFSETPASKNPTVESSVNTEEGYVSFDLTYGSGTTFPTRTQLNTEFNKQINENNVINTDAIKGIEYRYRLIAPEGTSEADLPRYFTNGGALKTKVYFNVDWPAGETETECYGNEGINGWHWGECISYEMDVKAKDTDYSGEWITVFINLDEVYKTNVHGYSKVYFWKDATKCKKFRVQFATKQSAPTANGVGRIDIDYVRFVMQDDTGVDEPAYVSHDFYDLRKGYVDVTFDKRLKYTAEDELNFMFKTDAFYTSKLLNVADNGNATYRIYAAESLVDKTVTFRDSILTSTGGFTIPNELAGVSHKYTAAEVTAKNDGENIFPNGDFSNPYYNVFKKENFHALELKDGALYVTSTDVATEWSTLTAPSVMKIKPNTNYYVSVDVDFVKEADDETTHHKDDNYGEVLTPYFPVLDGATSFSNGLGYESQARIGKVSYIPATNNAGLFLMKKSTLVENGNPTVVKLMDVQDSDYYADTEKMSFLTGQKNWAQYSSSFFDKASFYLQLCISNGKKEGLYTGTVGTNNVAYYPTLEGFTYKVNSVVIKEMFPVTLILEDGSTQTLYAAKDVAIKLPSDYEPESGKLLTGWTDGNTTYAPGADFVLTAPTATTLTAVTEHKPFTVKELSLRLDSYTGIRFKAGVTIKTKTNEKTTETGFIVTRKVFLDNAGINAADFTAESNVAKVSGVSYIKGSINKIFETDEKYTYFTAVLYNIPEDSYDEVFVSRPYLINDGVTTYGEPIAASAKEIATGIKNSESYNELSESAKAVVDKMAG